MDRDALQLLDYCIAHTTLEPSILYDLERETYLKTLAPQMSSGHLQGQFLRFLSKTSTIWFTVVQHKLLTTVSCSVT